VQSIKAVLFEPVGCLAEFAPDAFNRASADLFGASPQPAASGSQAYWELLGRMAQRVVAADDLLRLEAHELAAVEQAELYEDVRPSLQALKLLGIATLLVSSLSRRAVAAFIERHGLADLFAACVTRDEAGGILARPLRATLDAAGLAPAHVMALAYTAQGLELLKQLGLNAMLMFNDYDEGRALADRNPAGGIASLAELPAALQLIAQRCGLRTDPRTSSRPPRAPFELFDPS
jgi:phosphoglycolate phosphatase-like HAD superfamily hydrolase